LFSFVLIPSFLVFQGIIGSLDEVTKVPANLKGDGKGEAALLTKLKNNLSAPKTWTIKGIEVANAFAMTGVKDKYEGARGKGGFKVEHYAANVIYDVEEWCEKNNDKISKTKYDCIQKSGLIDAATPGRDPGDSRSLLAGFRLLRDPDDESSSRGGKAKPLTLASNFRDSLAELMAQLGKPTRCQFVRCLKPNTVKKPQRYEAGLILNQLQYTGMLDTLNIRKEGWPSRPTHDEFYLRYKPLFPSETDHEGILKRISDKTGIEVNRKGEKIAFVKGVKIFIGDDRVLMKDDVARMLEQDRTDMMRLHSLTVQSVWRACEYKKKFQNLRSCYHSIIGEARAFISREITVREAHWGRMEKDDASMHQYREEVKVEEAAEAEERRISMLEDDYMFHVMDGMRLQIYKMEKDTEMEGARNTYDKGKRLVDTLMASIAASDQESAAAAAAAADPKAKTPGQGLQAITLSRSNNDDSGAKSGRKTTRAKFRVSFKR